MATLEDVQRNSRHTRKSRQQAILAALREGTTRKNAANLAGTSYEMLWQWMQQYPSFAEEVLQAEAQSQEFFESHIKNAAPADWRAASFWLERRRRADYGPELNLRQVPTETLRELLADTTPLVVPKLNDADTIDGTFKPEE